MINVNELLIDYKNRFEELSNLLCYPEIQADKKLYTAYLNEFNKLKPFLECLENINLINEQKKTASIDIVLTALNEAYMKEIGKVERLLANQNMDEYQGAEIVFDSKDKALASKCETAFASNLILKGYKSEINNNKVIIRGISVYSTFKKFNGYIEVKKDKVFVRVFPYIEKEDAIDLSNIKIDYFHSSGAGGQNVNKVETAVRVYDYITGIVVTCQDERSQKQNKDKALSRLKDKVINYRKNEIKQIKEEIIKKSNKTQIGLVDKVEDIVW